MKRPTLVYDDDCGICREFKEVVEFLDPKSNIKFVSLREADQSGLLTPIPLAMRYRSFHLVQESAAVSGANAIIPLISNLPGGNVVAGLLSKLPLARSLIRFAYDALSRLHDTGSCVYPVESRPSHLVETSESKLKLELLRLPLLSQQAL